MANLIVNLVVLLHYGREGEVFKVEDNCFKFLGICVC